MPHVSTTMPYYRLLILCLMPPLYCHLHRAFICHTRCLRLLIYAAADTRDAVIPLFTDCRCRLLLLSAADAPLPPSRALFRCRADAYAIRAAKDYFIDYADTPARCAIFAADAA